MEPSTVTTPTVPGAHGAEHRVLPPSQPDDLSHHAHRQLIGWIGIVLPIVLVLLHAARPTAGLDPWVLDSISAYYYTRATAAFVGLLVALALFLFAYPGYGNEYRWADRTAAIVGGLAAMGVAFFPTGAPIPTLMPSWWEPLTGTIHYVSAIVLFCTFIVFALVLFRMTGDRAHVSPDKKLRNWVYLVCGIVMVGCVLWAGSSVFTGADIFLPESIALIAFATSWLVKGYAHRAVANVVMAPFRKR